MSKKLRFIWIIILGLCACQPAVVTPSAIPSPTLLPAPTLSLTPTPIQPATPSQTPAPTPTATLTPTQTVGASPSLAPTPAVVVKDGRGKFYETLFTIPIGKDALEYEGGDNGLEINGPTAITVLPDGSIVICDFVANRLRFYTPRGRLARTIELSPLGIVIATDLDSSRSALFVLDSAGPYRVDKISFEGKLEAVYDIPEGFHMEDGLTGIAVGGQGELILKLLGGSEFYELVDAQGQADNPPKRTGYPYGGRQYWVDNPGLGGTPSLTFGNIKIETQLSGGAAERLGGLKLVGVLPNGDFYVERDDLVTFSPINVDQTVHYMNAQGIQQGVTRFSDRLYYPIPNNFALTPDGNLIALLPRRDRMEVIRFNFYKRVQPLIPSAVEPLITLVDENP